MQRDTDAQAAELVREIEALAALAQLEIPGLIRMLDGDPDTPFLVVEYIPGQTLDELRQPNVPLPVRTILESAWQLALTLAQLHLLGVLHLDIKPSNALRMKSGLVKLIDFGSCWIAGHSQLWQHAPIHDDPDRTLGRTGTARYTSPEQFAHDQLTSASDIYSLGVTLYELLAGELPHPGETVRELRRRRLRDDPRDIRQFVPNLPEPIVRLVMDCLAREPRQRPTSLVVADRLGQILA
jgi:serine/threonine-protein kinase